MVVQKRGRPREASPVTSWQYEVATMFEGRETWGTNAVFFPDAEQADRAAQELLSRWLLPHAYRTVERKGTPPNYTMEPGDERPVPTDFWVPKAYDAKDTGPLPTVSAEDLAKGSSTYGPGEG